LKPIGEQKPKGVSFLLGREIADRE